MLDEKAKVFLKNLLDGATVRVLEAHSQVCLHSLCFAIVLLSGSAYNGPFEFRINVVSS